MELVILIAVVTPTQLSYQCMYMYVGVKVTVKGEEVTCRARLLFALTDLPAKASLNNMTQFNGRFGCPTCNHEGEQVLVWFHDSEYNTQ